MKGVDISTSISTRPRRPIIGHFLNSDLRENITSNMANGNAIKVNELLAEAIKANPVLYDKASEDFKDRKQEGFNLAGLSLKDQFFLR